MKVNGFPKIGKSSTTKSQCVACIKSSTKRAPIRQSHNQNTRPLELTHTDISGTISVPLIGNAHKFVVFFDVYLAMSSTYLILHKSQFLECLQG